MLRGFVALLVASSLLLVSCGGVSPFAGTTGTGDPSDPFEARDQPSSCTNGSLGLEPLPELNTAYKGQSGGLYPGGANQPPRAYANQGYDRSQRIVARDFTGSPDPNGKIVLLSIGLSNTTQEFTAFKRLAEQDARKNPALVLVDGAQAGKDAEHIRHGDDDFWSNLDARLMMAGVAPSQVQVVWMKEAIVNVSGDFPESARRLTDDLRAISGLLRLRFPHLQVIYLSSRTFAGYAETRMNPEPYAYESGFAVRWLIEERIAGPDDAPWLAWGPYLWTDGAKGRDDGLTWLCVDTAADGIHPSGSGRAKVAQLLLDFFRTDPFARIWFVAPTVSPTNGQS